MSKLLLTGDWHLRKTVPRCRMQTEEQWFEHQRSVLAFIVKTANDTNSDLFVNGDVFDKSIIHPSLLTMLIVELSPLKGVAYIDYGNHDQAARSDDLSMTTFGTLDAIKEISGKIKNISEAQAWVPYGKEDPIANENAEVLFLHTLTVESDEDKKFFDAVTARYLLNQYPDYKFIATSDNHKAFVYTKGKRILVNPGCITKQSATFKDADLCVYLLNTVDATVIPIHLPTDNDVVDDRYLVEEKERETRISAFIESLKNSREVSLSFRHNVENALPKVLTLETQHMIQELMGGEE